VLDKAIEWPPQWHQAAYFFGMNIGNSAGLRAVHDLTPLRDTVLLKP
jgi:hypothetical protein